MFRCLQILYTMYIASHISEYWCADCFAKMPIPFHEVRLIGFDGGNYIRVSSSDIFALFLIF